MNKTHKKVYVVFRAKCEQKKFPIQILSTVMPNRSNITKAVKLTDRILFVCGALEMQTQLERRAIERHAPPTIVTCHLLVKF